MGFLARLFGSARSSATTSPATRHAPQNDAVFAVLDVETTGLSPRSDRIIELAIVRLDGHGHVLDEWASRFNPQGPVGATHIHGITEADVRNAPLFADLIAHISHRLAGTVIVAHNSRFDLGFLAEEFKRAGWRWPDAPTLCTMAASWHYSPNLARRRLADCCADNGVRLDRAHSALGDARAAAALLGAWLRRHPVYPDLDPAMRKRMGVTWPNAPLGPAQRAQRPAPARTSAPQRRRPAVTPAPALGAMLAKMHFDIETTDDEPLGGERRIAVQSYLEKLTEACSDGVLTEDEVEHLADLAGVYDLDAETVASAHLAVIRGVTMFALIDGKVSTAERAEIKHLATQLGVDDKTVKTFMAEHRQARLDALSEGLPPLPDGWTLGEPVRVGDKVAFTGGDSSVRERLEAVAADAGVEVMSSVSRFTNLLVSDGIESGKAAAAREHGVRVVTYREFTDLLKWRQPARPR